MNSTSILARVSVIAAAALLLSGLSVPLAANASPAARATTATGAALPQVSHVIAPSDATPTGSISGVVDPVGSTHGIAGIEVGAYDSDGDQVAAATTNSSGAYSIASIGAGEYSLDFVSTGYYISEWSGGAATQDAASTVTVTASANTVSSISLTLGGTVAGTLTDPSTTDGVAGVTVTLLDSDGDDVVQTQTNDSGAYTISGVAAGSYGLRFNPPTPYVTEWWDNDLYDTAGDTVTITAGATTTASMALYSGTSVLSGTVTSAATGDPLAGISVDVYGVDELSPAVAGTTTDASGNYSLSGIDPDGVYLIKFSDPVQGAYAYQYWQNSSLQSTARTEQVFGDYTGFDASLAPAASISGTVKGSDTNGALSGVHVYAYDSDGNLAGTAQTNSSGHYAVAGLPGGSYSLKFASISGYAGQWWSGQALVTKAGTVAVASGGSSTANATLTALVGTISGTVYTADPLQGEAGVGVVAYDAAGTEVASAQTDSSGAYSISDLPVGSYKLQYVYSGSDGFVGQWSGGGSWEDTASTVGVTVGTVTTANAVLAVQGTINGVISGADTGEPITGVIIDVYDAENNLVEEGDADDSGSYSITGLAAGSYTVNFQYVGSDNYISQDWSDGSQTTVPVAAGAASTANVSLVLAQSATVSGVVKGSDTGTGASGIEVEFYYATGIYAGSEVQSTTTNSQGAYTMTGLMPGSYKVEFVDSTGKYGFQWSGNKSLQSAGSVITVGSAATATQNATLALAASISGTVYAINTSATVNKAAVTVYDADGNIVSNPQTNSSGVYLAKGLAAGSYTVEFQYSGYDVNWWSGSSTKGGETAITLAAGGSATAGAGLTPYGDEYIYGTVVGSDLTTPVDNATVTAYDSYGDYAGYGETDSSGNYGIDVVPGTYTLYISGAGDFIGQWWHGESSQGTADSVLVTTNGSAQANAALALGGTISGTVTRSDTVGGLNDVTVAAYDTSGNEAGEASTDASGNYTIAGLPTGSYTLDFTSPTYNYASQWWGGNSVESSASTVQVTAGGASTADITLRPNWSTISGTVFDDQTGLGISGIIVEATDTNGVQVAYTITDTAGHYTFTQLPSDNYTLVYLDESNRYESGDWPDPSDVNSSEPIAVGVGTTTIANAGLQEVGSIEGTITGADTGFGVSHTQVDVYDSDGNLVQDFPAGAGDTYSMGNLVPGSYTVDFTYEGSGNYVSQWWSGESSQGTADTVTVVGGQATTANAVLTAGGTISGVVHEGDHTTVGVANVEVDVFDTDGDFINSTSTDNSGAYELEGLESGKYTIEFDGTGTSYLTQWWNGRDSQGDADALTVVAGDNSTANATLPLGGSISGVITSSDTHAAVANVEVDVFDANTVDVGTTETNSSGHYTIGGLPTGTYSVEFSDFDVYPTQWYNDGSSAETTISVTTGLTTTTNFALIPGGTVAGTVTSASSGHAPLKDVDVAVYDANGDDLGDEVTNSSGKYSIGGVAVGTYKVQFVDQDGGYATEWWNGQALESAASPVTIAARATTTLNETLAVSGQIAGVVTAADTSLPLSDISVTVYDADGNYASSTSTGDDGSFDVDGLAAGSYTVQLDDQDSEVYALQWWNGQTEQGSASTVTVTSGQTTTIDPTMAVGGTLAGTVKGVDTDAGLSEVEIDAYTLDGAEAGSAFTDDDGDYSLTGLPAGPVKVEFSYYGDANYAPQWWNDKTSMATATSIQITSGETSTANGTLGLGGSIAGTVTGQDTGTGVGYVIVTVYDSTGTELNDSFETDSSGTYQINDLPTGNYTLEFQYVGPSGYTTQWWNGETSAGTADPVGVAAGETTTINPVMVKTASLSTLTTAVPTITGTTSDGQTLTANAGTWGPQPVTLSYQWNNNGTPISGATLSTYVLGATDVGDKITVTVTGTKTGYQSASTTSAATATITALTFATNTVSISGSPVVGGTLSADAGSWTPTPTSVSYTWRRNGTTIAGQTGQTYNLTSADLGASISVVVTASLSGYTTYAVTSASVLVPRLLTATPTPAIAGTVVVGSTLTASAGVWAPAPVTLHYQWNRDGVAIAGAVSATYVVVAADGGGSLTVSVTGSKTGYTSVTKTSSGRAVSLCVRASAWFIGCVIPRSRNSLRAPASLLTSVKPATTSAASVGESVGADTSSSGTDVTRQGVARFVRAV